MRLRGQNAIAPDSLSYSIIARAWANSSHPTGAERASWWLGKLWRDFEAFGDERLRPTTSIYNSVMLSWNQVQKPEVAETYLNDLMEHFERRSVPNLVPNSESFVNVIRGWLDLGMKGSQDAVGKAAHWLDVLQKLEDAEIAGVTTVPELYDMILRATARCASTCPDVLDLAFHVFGALRRSRHSLTSQSYARLLRTGLLALSLPENNQLRESFVKELIKDCAESGLVGGPVIVALSNCPVFYSGWTLQESERLTAEVFPQWPLPPSWTRNLPSDYFPTEQDLIRTGNEISPHRHGPGLNKLRPVR